MTITQAPLIPRTVEPGEVVSLRERLGRLQALRVALVLVALGGATYGFETSGGALTQLWLASGAYLAAIAATDLLRRGGRRSSLGALAGMLLLDGAYLTFATYLTGGTQSPLWFLLYVHLVAVTLLASYRTGLKIALWQSLLTMVALYAQAAGLIPARESAPGVVPEPGAGLAPLAVFNVTAFWVVALVTAACSSLNERELRRRRADSDALATMATELEGVRRPAEVGERLLAWLGDRFGFTRGVVLSSRDSVGVLASVGADADAPVGEELDQVVKDAWSCRQPMLVRRLDPRFNPTLAALLPNARRVLVLPLSAEDELLGAVAVEHAGAGWRLERRIVAMASQLVAYAALALSNAWLLEQIQRMADTDGLTGAANRRTFDATLARELARARREGGPVTLALLDVDHFKWFNDRHGHLAGDAVLQGLARALEQHMRPFDTVARYGGEEFAVVLPGCSAEQAVEAAERLRRAAGAIRAEAPVTVSVGVATFPAHAAEAETLVRAADEALYASKSAGRDRVTSAERQAR